MPKNLLTSALAIALIGQSVAAQAQGGPSSTVLKMDPTMLDWSGEKRMGEMYMPSAAALTSTKPSWVRKEPGYSAAPLYGVIELGNGPKSRHAFAIDPVKGAAKIYVDMDGDGDLTKGADWSGKVLDSGITNYQGTFLFRVSYGNATREASHDSYGLNMYWADGRSSLFYYRAGVATGKIKIGAQTYSVKVIDQNNEALYDLPFRVADKPTKPIFLCLDEVRFDARGTFALDGTNYMAMLSPDGSRLTVKATSKAITPPQPKVAEKEPDLLAVGTDAPDFEVPAWGGGNLRLSDLRGKVVVLDFWATWCGPCKASLPHVEKVNEKVKDQNVYVLALNVFDDKAAYTQWVPSNPQYKFHFAYDPAGRDDSSIAKSKYMVSGIPTTYVIGPDGKVAAAILGFEGLDDHRLEAALAKLGVKV